MNGKTPTQQWYEETIARCREELAEREEELANIEEWSSNFYEIHPVKNRRNLAKTHLDGMLDAYTRDYFWSTIDKLRDI